MTNESVTQNTRTLRITGEFVTRMLRSRPQTAFADAVGAGMDIKVLELQAILDCTARIEGDNVDGYRLIQETST